VVIATRAGERDPAGRPERAPDRRAGAWWIDKLKASGWKIGKAEIREGRDVSLWLRK
jgi:hypothetical protein